MSSEERSTFHWADYLVFALSLVASLAVGVYHAIKDRKKTNNEDYLMAGRSMSVIPVTASTFATLVSSIAFVAEPVEVYYFGLNYVFISLGTCLGFIPVAAIFAPTFHKLNLISAFSVRAASMSMECVCACVCVCLCVCIYMHFSPAPYPYLYMSVFLFLYILPNSGIPRALWEE